jgi:hypothetical protein
MVPGLGGSANREGECGEVQREQRTGPGSDCSGCGQPRTIAGPTGDCDACPLHLMNVIEEHISVDGLLRFVACRDYDGDMTLGFAVVCREGDNDMTSRFYGHTHADILASLYGLPETEAVRNYIDDILEDRTVIAVSRIDDGIRDIWVSDAPVSELSYKPSEETIEFRYWSGRRL